MDLISLEELQEELGIEFSGQDRWSEIKAGISLDWLMRDAGLSERQKIAVEKYLGGEKYNKDNIYHAKRKMKRFARKLVVV